MRKGSWGWGLAGKQRQAQKQKMALGLVPLLALPVLVTGGALYQGLATVRDRRRYPPPGKTIFVEGRGLHLVEMGSGTPTVLLETGLGGMSSAWGWIQPELAKATRVVAYDRPGLGWSDPVPPEMTAQDRARQLHAALDQAGIRGPYLLVGHSMGGMLVRIFHDLYPDQVAGVLLIDASHPDQHRHSAAIRRHMTSGFRLLRHVQLLTRIGYVRLSNFFASQAEGLPRRQQDEARAFLCSSRHLKHTNDEGRRWDLLCDEVRATGDLGDKPLTVIAASKGTLPGARQMQEDLARLSSRSRLLFLRGADHVTLVTHREHALTVAGEVRHLVAEWRQFHSEPGAQR
ncbi:alpha/beta hydrolase [Geomesophilobacter sediminis]|uniref:Alpha/beta hydrolase n=1 Tax=Geomesophilobacter sediminis TaxID=2798584 RepID=A0A8J7LV24_9BACT|nr:alpha/beta hydrolase [Geomesophilobacter sediminis]MBJ6724450.1 alpha/beta hydrolase [Geomesophilobacter sediminis]